MQSTLFVILIIYYSCCIQMIGKCLYVFMTYKLLVTLRCDFRCFILYIMWNGTFLYTFSLCFLNFFAEAMLWLVISDCHLFQGISSVAFVHCIEFFRQKYRGVVMVGFGMSWAFAQLLSALFAYIFPDWRNIQRAASALAIITIPYFWYVIILELFYLAGGSL